ncbi:MAG: MBL fold metallo-hydrolase [Spirochaetes bacterium]|nr:MBL fold metallo-hydrolase [Spirochaetota bacterium]
MEIEFVGGARTVTGSSFILKDKDFQIMVDCGMFQGRSQIRERNSLNLIYAPAEIDTLLLTHAHIDHSGLIPKLVKEGFTGKIFATSPTADLCAVMLPDSAHIQEMEVEWTNKKNKRLGLPLHDPIYTVVDAEESIEHYVRVGYGNKIKIHPRIEARFRDAGHILGSSMIELWVDGERGKTKIVFSGDLGQEDTAFIRDPEIIEEADILLIESTYGNRLHRKKEDTLTEFKEIILNSYNNRGNIIIPAFAVERTQEIIYTLSKLFRSKEIPEIPVYIDSPLAISATEIFRKNGDYFDEETKKILLSGNSPLDFPNLYFTKTAEESKRLNEEVNGAIIISASGMCTAGRIKYHLLHNLYKPESCVIFVGFQAEGTLGRSLVDGAKRVKLFGEEVIVNAKIHTLGGFSAHADRDGLLDWMGNIKNNKLKVFVVHGEEEASQKFAESVRTRFGYDTYVPNWGEIVDLATMRSRIAPYGVSGAYTTVDREVEALTESLKSLTEQYRRARDGRRIKDMKKLQTDLNDAREMIALIMDEL